MRRLSEAVARRVSGKYEPANVEGLPDHPDLLEAEKYMTFLENNGFVWFPKKIDISYGTNLCEVFGNHRRYSSEGLTDTRDGKEFPLRFAFGDGSRVYRLYVVEQHRQTNYVRYQFDVQRRNGIIIYFDNYKQWLDSAIKFFGLK